MYLEVKYGWNSKKNRDRLLKTVTQLDRQIEECMKKSCVDFELVDVKSDDETGERILRFISDEIEIGEPLTDEQRKKLLAEARKKRKKE